MTEEAVKTRARLTIIEAKPPEPVGERKTLKLTFKAKGEDGKEFTYFTFSQRLFPFIRLGDTIEADVEAKDREVGNVVYHDLKVVEIYQDGQPIGSAKQPWTPRRQADPEERASIEAQVAYKGAIELLSTKVIGLDNPFAQIAVLWGWSRLGGALGDIKPETLQRQKPAETQTTKEAKPAGVASGIPKQGDASPVFKNPRQLASEAGGEFENVPASLQAALPVFFECCLQHPQIKKQQSEVLLLLGKTLRDLQDLPKDWRDLKKRLGVK